MQNRSSEDTADKHVTQASFQIRCAQLNNPRWLFSLGEYLLEARLSSLICRLLSHDNYYFKKTSLFNFTMRLSLFFFKSSSCLRVCF